VIEAAGRTNSVIHPNRRPVPYRGSRRRAAATGPYPRRRRPRHL